MPSNEEVNRLLRMRAHMALHGLTTQKLAAELQVSQSSVSVMLRARFISEKRHDQLLRLGFPEDTIPAKRISNSYVKRQDIEKALSE